MRILTTSMLTLCFILSSYAHEGMWLPMLLKSLNESDMQSKGLKLSAEDIYAVNKSSLKDAVVHFGGYCTAEVVSDKGLIFTNHHCGYGEIQKHSSLENNYLKDGFWAKNNQEEKACNDLYVRFIRSMEDVSLDVLEGTNGVTEQERQKRIAENIKKIKSTRETGSYEVIIRAFDYGNAYYLFTTEKFEDVRFVGAPPSSIGKYGHDTDNWVWPRHTGDFSVFRIYADENNKAASYAESNKPYKPVYSFPISMKPLEKNDFTMVFGFPGRTQHYLTSTELDYVVNKSNPAKINMREKALEIIDEAMQKDELVSIQYASKQSGIANAWKKWKGQNLGLKKFKAVEERKDQEAVFLELLKEDEEGSAYASLLTQIEDLLITTEKERFAFDIFNEYYRHGTELFAFMRNYSKFLREVKSSPEKVDYEKWKQNFTNQAESFFNNWNQQVDKNVFIHLTELFYEYVSDDVLTEGLESRKSNSGYQAIADQFYSKSIFASKENVLAFVEKLNSKSIKKLEKDPFFTMRNDLVDMYLKNISETLSNYEVVKEGLMRDYVRLQKKLLKDKVQWFDANNTLRLTYGKVEGSEPIDGIEYKFYTTMDGLMDKYIPGDYEYDVPKKLIDLYNEKDYGPYANDGEMRVCFLASNHTSGGNSGSPVINAKGELIGINFDRSWESTMSDLRFSPEICRNISVDIKYVLFVIDKLGGATHLIEELNLVK